MPTLKRPLDQPSAPPSKRQASAPVLPTKIYLVRSIKWNYHPNGENEDEIIGYYVSLTDANRKAKAVASREFDRVESFKDEGMISYTDADDDEADGQPNIMVESVLLKPEGSEVDVQTVPGWETKQDPSDSELGSEENSEEEKEDDDDEEPEEEEDEH